MSRLKSLLLIAALGLALPALAGDDPKSVLDFKVKSIDGKTVKLSKYKGKVLLIVNVASKCGLTPQYEHLEKIYKKYNKKGFEILAFPANDFLGQEPGSNKEIKKFCTDTYGVTFPMFEKITVKGEKMHPLYKFLTDKATNGKHGGPIRWNFDKFLVDRTGKVVARFHPRMSPDKPQITKNIEALLKDG